MTATIDKLTVTVGDQTLTFTLAEAEALRKVLNDKLGQPARVLERIIERQAPVIMPREWRQAPDSTPYRPWEVICEQRPSSICLG